MPKIGLNLPYNQTSLGNLGILISKVLYDREKSGKSDLDISIFPIGGVDLSGWKEDKGFNEWLQKKAINGMENWDRKTSLLKLWHINGSETSHSNNQCLLSFYELDRPSKVELNICRNNRMCFSSMYTVDTFKIYGVDSKYIPLAFDDYNFAKTDKKYYQDDRISFGLFGKAEARKSHKQVIQAWIKKYGNNPKYILHCSIYNDFLVQNVNGQVVDYNNQFVAECVGGNKLYNVVFYPKTRENLLYNDMLNACNICISMSRGESWGLPEFHATAMGKYNICLNAHGYKNWANDKNSILVSPNGKEEAKDNIFFHGGNSPFNVGNWFTWSDDEFLSACDEAIKRVESNPLNTEGLKLQQEFSKDRFVDSLLDYTLN